MRPNVSSSSTPPFPRRAAVIVTVAALCLACLSTVARPGVPSATAADPVCTVSAKLVNSCRPWVGAESGGYGPTGFRAAMLEHEARIGRQLDIVHEYLGTGNITLTNDVVTMAKRPDTIALVNWRVATRWALGDGSSATVNAQIDGMANSIKALGTTKIMLTLHHEPENDISPGGDPNCPTTTFVGTSGAVSDYVNMWHNVRARFDALGVTNVVWVMNYMGWKAWNCVVKSMWPGNDHIDWVMWNPYPKTATWTAFVNLFYNYLSANSDAQHDFLSKPVGPGGVRLRRQQPDRRVRDVRRGAAQRAQRRLSAAEGLRRVGQPHVQQPRRPRGLHRDPRGRPRGAAALQRLRQRPADDRHRGTPRPSTTRRRPRPVA